MATHKLKTWAPYFADLWSGEKRFELRRDDRQYAVGDLLVLEEYEMAERSYSGRRIHAKVGYVLRDCDAFGLMSDHVVMGLETMSNIDDRSRP